LTEENLDILDQIEIAGALATEAHFGQTEESTGEPYIRHVERVAALTPLPADKPAAWLHDILEDCGTTAYDLLKAGINQATVDAVVLLTWNKDVDIYPAYIARIGQSGNKTALAVKIADLIDHFRPGCPERLRPRYEAAWVVLVDECRVCGKRVRPDEDTTHMPEHVSCYHGGL
jgi:hypothetical protein